MTCPLDVTIRPASAARVRVALARIISGRSEAVRIDGIDMEISIDELEEIGEQFTRYAKEARTNKRASWVRWQTGAKRPTPPPGSGVAPSAPKRSK